MPQPLGINNNYPNSNSNGRLNFNLKINIKWMLIQKFFSSINKGVWFKWFGAKEEMKILYT
jgi:hypothetical protein